jgi:hypothetical protein
MSEGNMSCVLRVAGRSFDATAFLRDSSIQGSLYRKALHRFGPVPASENPPLVSRAGFNSTVSTAGFDDLGAQVRDAIEFLKTQEAE